MKLVLAIFTISISVCISANNYSEMPGRISKINLLGRLVRIRIRSKNIKFFNKSDRLKFWGYGNSSKQCRGKVAGKTNEYLLVKVPDIELCIKYTSIVVGGKVSVFGRTFTDKIHMANEVVSLLSKKRLAIDGRIRQSEKEMISFYDKIEAVNQRYSILLEKLKGQWKDEIRDLEHDKLTAENAYNHYRIKRDDIDFKLERYRVSNDQLEKDRWALDSQFYYRK
ncbi:hypothetical protein OAB57_00870 [Bacteriovoracaceae bacterium]|nr:hypothetical protein [Bacteriovoracaceae bacterium]